MKKLLSLIFVSLLLSGNAYAFCIFGNCEAKEACRDYAKSADGDQDDAYNYCMEREGNEKNYGVRLYLFIRQEYL